MAPRPTRTYHQIIAEDGEPLTMVPTPDGVTFATNLDGRDYDEPMVVVVASPALSTELVRHGARRWGGGELVTMATGTTWHTGLEPADLMAACESITHDADGLVATFNPGAVLMICAPATVWFGTLNSTGALSAVASMWTCAVSRGMASVFRPLPSPWWKVQPMVRAAAHRIDSSLMVRPMKVSKAGTLFDPTPEAVRKVRHKARKLWQKTEDEWRQRQIDEIEHVMDQMRSNKLPQHVLDRWAMTADERKVDSLLVDAFAVRNYPGTVTWDSRASLMAELGWPDNPHSRQRLRTALGLLSTVHRPSVYRFKMKDSRTKKDVHRWFGTLEPIWQVLTDLEQGTAIAITARRNLSHQVDERHGGSWYVNLPRGRFQHLESVAGSVHLAADATDVYERTTRDATAARPDAATPGQVVLSYTISAWAAQWTSRDATPVTIRPVEPADQDEADQRERIRTAMADAEADGRKAPTDAELARLLGVTARRARELRARAGITKHKGARPLRPREVRQRLVDALTTIQVAYPGHVIRWKAEVGQDRISIVVAKG